MLCPFESRAALGRPFVRETKDRTAVTDKGSITADRVVCATHFPFISKHPRQLKLPGVLAAV